MSNIDNKEFSDVCDNFTAMLRPETILAFRHECLTSSQEYPTKGNEKKIAKAVFISSLNNVFDKSPSYNHLYRRIFNRFKSYNCQLNQPKNDLFSIGNLSSSVEEIDLYEVCCAFIIFSRYSFKKKLLFLFELTDYDNDDLINEREIRKIIFTMNLLFCVEEGMIKIDSRLIHQALAYQKANHIYSKLMKHPGQLASIIAKEKVIPFDTFFAALEKIENYKTSIIPFYINFSQCLSETKTETIIELKKSLSDEFITISNDLIHCRNSVIGKKDIRKTIEFIALTPRVSSPTNIIFQKKKDKSKKIKKGLFIKKRLHPQMMMNKTTGFQMGKIDYSKIYNLEVPPVQIIVKKDDNPNNNNNETEQTIKGVVSKRKIRTNLPKVSSTGMMGMSKTFTNHFNPQNELKTFNEVIGELDNVLLRRQYDENYWAHMKDNLIKVNENATAMKKYFRDKTQFYNLKHTSAADIVKGKKI